MHYDPNKENTAPFRNYAARVARNTIYKEFRSIKRHYPEAINITDDHMIGYCYVEDGYEDCEWNDVKKKLMDVKRKVMRSESLVRQTTYRLWLEIGNCAEVARLMHKSRVSVAKHVALITKKIKQAWETEIAM